ncbi:hypothetical protein [Methanolobus sp.]|jgi:hypothetical protein|uniref:hypothetical protein n=1 Tax=Methanolobus sp. TaxID=1874737 RepID=UPI0025D8E8A6|nr:hypothetical protein [Methanolobus sp.]
METYVPLENEIIPLIEQDKTFNASDVAEMAGLDTEGTQKFIVTMLSMKKIIDVGFRTSRYPGIKNK